MRPDIDIFEAPIRVQTFLKPDILGLVDVAAKKNALDFWTLVAQVEKESSGNPNAIRLEPNFKWFYPKGVFLAGDELEFQRTSWGLLQIMGATARELGYTVPATPWPSGPLKADAVAALDLGCRYMASKIQRWGNIHDALSAYNAGSPTTKNFPTYVQPILDRAAALTV
jgi:soluble lytic murein transglycosylase-like protein